MKETQSEFPFAIAHGRGCYVLKNRALVDRMFGALHARVEDELLRVTWYNEFWNVLANLAEALDPDDGQWRPSHMRECAFSTLAAIKPERSGELPFPALEVELARELANELLTLTQAVARMVNHERFEYDRWRIAA